MHELPVERLNTQFEVISNICKPILLKESIQPRRTERTISYMNGVASNTLERSLNAQKFFNYCKQYVAFFQSRSYQFLFVDYSLGRFVYKFDEANLLVSANLYWNPCPLNDGFIKKLTEYDFDAMEYIDNITAKERIELDDISLRTPVRLDFDRDYTGKNYKYHPLWHMHYQNKNTRIKIDKQSVICLYSYLLFVLENFYPDIYQDKQNSDLIDKLIKLEKESRSQFIVKKMEKSELESNVRTKILI